jgi:hypothetical protein
MKRLLMAVTALLLVTAASSRSTAQIHDGVVCWDPDIEFPVPCDEDDD